MIVHILESNETLVSIDWKYYFLCCDKLYILIIVIFNVQ